MDEFARAVIENRRKRQQRARMAAIICAIISAVLLAFALLSSGPAADALSYIGDATGISSANAEARATVDEYTTFQSTPDATWEAGARDVPLLIANPTGNPVDMAPHVYLDVNADGAFTEDECLFNPIVYRLDNSVDSYGSFIAPGTQLDSITLTHPIDAGTYEGAVVYTALHVDSHTPANGMTMHFTVTVA